MISNELRERGCVVVNAPVYADVDIAMAPVKKSLQRTTTLIGDNTNLLVLLLHYAQGDSNGLYFKSHN